MACWAHHMECDRSRRLGVMVPQTCKRTQTTWYQLVRWHSLFIKHKQELKPTCGRCFQSPGIPHACTEDWGWLLCLKLTEYTPLHCVEERPRDQKEKWGNIREKNSKSYRFKANHRLIKVHCFSNVMHFVLHTRCLCSHCTLQQQDIQELWRVIWFPGESPPTRHHESLVHLQNTTLWIK